MTDSSFRRTLVRAKGTAGRAAASALARAGYERATAERTFDAVTTATIEAVRPFTMTSPERISALVTAIAHVERYSIPGAIVERGVWRGGSSMAAARTLLNHGSTSRDLYLFDTFEGMTEPTAADLDPDGTTAAQLLAEADHSELIWCDASFDDVERNMTSVGYPAERIHFVKGPVEETIPENAPETIAVLRLDTDWYESTHHELIHLMDRVSDDGVLIIDDYGHWQGARKAVDEFLATYQRPVMLNYVDYTGRMGIVGRRPTGV